MKLLRGIAFTLLAGVSLVCIAAALTLLYYGMTPGTHTTNVPSGDAIRETGRSILEHTKNAVDNLKVDWPSPPSESPPTTGPSGTLRVFFAPCRPDDPDGMHAQFLAFLGSAQSSIYGAFFELSLEDVADLLIAKHRAGVEVRLVTDSRYKDRDALKRCMDAGIPVVFDERSAYMHDKFCVVDGNATWTGSTNITENGFYKNDNNAIWIDAPSLAADYTAEFGEMFNDRQFGPRSPANTPAPTVTVGSTTVDCYFAPEDHVRQYVINAIDTAEKEVDFMAFSFTSKEIARALIQRLDAGVRVRGLVESRNAGSTYSQDDVLAAHGAQVYLDTNPATMHNKVFILDARTVVTGSYNFSVSAEESNDENVLIIHDPAIAASYRAVFESLIPKSAASADAPTTKEPGQTLKNFLMRVTTPKLLQIIDLQ